MVQGSFDSAQDDKGNGSRLSALGKETPGYAVEAMRLKQNRKGGPLVQVHPYSAHQSDRAIQSNYSRFTTTTILAGLQRDVHGDADSRVLAVVEVISIVHVIDVDLVSPVPGRRPGFRPGVYQAEPEA
jgi:hypothetical protein